MIAGNEPDVIMITEMIPKSQTNPIAPALLHLDGYEPHFNFDLKKDNLGGSGIRGVAIYTRLSLTVREIDLLPEDNFKDHIWVEIMSVDTPILAGCIYRSPSSDSTKESALASAISTSRLITSACRMNSTVIITGDFNYREIDWENEYAPPDKENQRHFIKSLQDCYLFQHVSEPTRYRQDENPNLLDLVLSGEEGMVCDLDYLPPLGESDHVCIRFNVKCTQSTEIPETKKRNIFKANYAGMVEKLSHYDWDILLNSNFSKDYETFFGILEVLLEENTPYKTPKKTKKNLYLTREAEKLKMKKNKLWRKYKSTKSAFDKAKFNHCKNSLRSLTRKLRNEFEKEISKVCKEKPKMFWNYAKSRLKTRDNISSLKRADDSVASSPADKAEVLNSFFASVFTLEDLQTIPRPPTYDINEILTTINITPDLVKEKLDGLNPNKSPGHDKWHPHFLRELSGAICKPLAILFRKSLKEGSHSSWRKAIVTAIFKKGKKTDPGNYRPVSLTSVVSKIMESIVRDEIVSHLMKNNLITDAQHGFVPGRDCMTQLLECIEDWTRRLECGNAFDVIYTDFSKAFDSVPHERLFLKLESIGIKGDVLNWVKSSLRGRTQCVNVDGKIYMVRRIIWYSTRIRDRTDLICYFHQ